MFEFLPEDGMAPSCPVLQVFRILHRSWIYYQLVFHSIHKIEHSFFHSLIKFTALHCRNVYRILTPRIRPYYSDGRSFLQGPKAVIQFQDGLLPRDCRNFYRILLPKLKDHYSDGRQGPEELKKQEELFSPVTWMA